MDREELCVSRVEIFNKALELFDHLEDLDDDAPLKNQLLDEIKELMKGRFGSVVEMVSRGTIKL